MTNLNFPARRRVWVIAPIHPTRGFLAAKIRKIKSAYFYDKPIIHPILAF